MTALRRRSRLLAIRVPAEPSIDQAALLAGLIRSPSTYAPTVNPDRAIACRNVVPDDGRIRRD
jgi:hypothetical protein